MNFRFKYWITIAGLIGGLFFVWLMVNVAHANGRESLPGNCRPTTEIIEKELWNKHKEVPVGFAITSQGGKVTIFHNSERTSWSFVVESPGVIACLVSEGQYIEFFEYKEPGTES